MHMAVITSPNIFFFFFAEIFSFFIKAFYNPGPDGGIEVSAHFLYCPGSY